MWLACGGPLDKKAVIYRYFESRHPKFIKPFINGFQGWLQTDEYGGYEAALEEHEKLYPDDPERDGFILWFVASNSLLMNFPK